MNPLITILAHGGTQGVIERHLPIWKKHGWPIQFFFPKDIGTQDWLVETKEYIGTSGQGGTRATADREMEQIHRISKTGASHHIIFEYDSFMTSSPPLVNGCFGILFNNMEPPKYSCPIYPNPPWLIDGESLREMSALFTRFPSMCELGHMDRIVAAAAMNCGIPIMPYDPPGFSRGTIQSEQDICGLSLAMECGAYAFHGIKTEPILEFILKKARKTPA